jgi:hypothetical protein
VDIDEEKTEMLNSGRAWFPEPAYDRRYRATSPQQAPIRYELRRGAKLTPAHFLGVATPGDGSQDL